MGGILIVAEIQGGQIRECSFELATFAQKLASATGRELNSVVLGKDVSGLAEAFAKRGGGKVFVGDHELLANYCVESANASIRAAIEASGADLILFETFNKVEGMFVIKCDVHPWMKAYIEVMSHPFFDVTGTDGKFEIGDLPAGTYEIEIWHEKLGTQSQSVTVADGDTKTLDFTMSPPSKK